jgi:hypothetical protein
MATINPVNTVERQLRSKALMVHLAGEIVRVKMKERDITLIDFHLWRKQVNQRQSIADREACDRWVRLVVWQ